MPAPEASPILRRVIYWFKLMGFQGLGKRGISPKFGCQAFCSDGSLGTTVWQIIFKAKKHFEPVSGLVVHHKGFMHESYLSPMGKGGSLL